MQSCRSHPKPQAEVQCWAKRCPRTRTYWWRKFKLNCKICSSKHRLLSKSRCVFIDSCQSNVQARTQQLTGCYIASWLASGSMLGQTGYFFLDLRHVHMTGHAFETQGPCLNYTVFVVLIWEVLSILPLDIGVVQSWQQALQAFQLQQVLTQQQQHGESHLVHFTLSQDGHALVLKHHWHWLSMYLR